MFVLESNKLKMSYIDLNQNTEKTQQKLNSLLATYQLYYQNMRGFHWNIKGENFFELHVKFEEFYTGAAATIDEIAERILTLGGTPLHTFDDYINHSTIKPVKDLNEGKAIMNHIYDMHTVLLGLLREAVALAADQDDEGTQDMLTPVISELEKTNWMVGAWLRK